MLRALYSKRILCQVLMLKPVAVESIHSTATLRGTGNPAQAKIIEKHSEYYQDFWSHDLESWSDNNKMVFPPSKPGEPHRPAEIYHGRALIRYSPKKMYYMTKLVQNMNVDDAINYMKFVKMKGARIIQEILIEAQEIAVKDHNVEYKSNLHVVESFVLPAGSRKIIKFHSFGRTAMNRSRFCNYYLMLREGQAPDWQPKVTAYSAAVAYIEKLKGRTIRDGL